MYINPFKINRLANHKLSITLKRLKVKLDQNSVTYKNNIQYM